ncbi:MAG: Rieske (2Fe-2S) protein [Bryobacteraceae bacterium]
MAFVKAGSLSRLQPNSVMEVMIGETPYALCNINGKLHALAGTCPHRGGPLGQGVVAGANLVCPWHAWEFDCATGQNDYDPACRVATFAVRAEGDELLIDAG